MGCLPSRQALANRTASSAPPTRAFSQRPRDIGIGWTVRRHAGPTRAANESRATQHTQFLPIYMHRKLDFGCLISKKRSNPLLQVVGRLGQGPSEDFSANCEARTERSKVPVDVAKNHLGLGFDHVTYVIGLGERFVIRKTTVNALRMLPVSVGASRAFEMPT